MNILLVLPIIIPFITAILSLLAWNYVPLQRILTLIGMGALLISGIVLLDTIHSEGIQAVQIGSWQAPIGITIVADLFSAIMVTVTGLMGLCVAIYSLSSIDHQREKFGYYPLMSILLMGVCGAFMTGDMFNLYVWFEVLLISSFVLLALGGERQQVAGAINYVTLNLVSSAIFLAAVGMLYSVAGTLNMADLSQQLPHVQQDGIVSVLAVMFLVSFGIKAAIFPLFFWLPTSYHTPPISVTAVFAGLLTKVGVYALIRVFTLLFVHDTDFTHNLILILAGLTMTSGVLGAIAQNEFRRILSYHIISQIGYMLIGLGLFTPLALAGSIFYIVHHIIVKTNLFLVSGVVYRLRNTYKLDNLGGLYRSSPLISIAFFIAALSLSGIPPLSGFWSKFILVRAGFEAENYWIIAVALCVSLFSLYSMMKIWREVFLKNPPETDEASEFEKPDLPLLLPILTLATITVLIGLSANPIFELAQDAANQLFDTSEYVQAVLEVR